MDCGLIVNVAGSMSTSSGSAPASSIAATVATEVSPNAAITNSVTYSSTFGSGQSSVAFSTAPSITTVIDLDREISSTLTTPDHLFTLTIPAAALPVDTDKLVYTRLAHSTVANPTEFAGLVFDLKLVNGAGQVLTHPIFDYPLTLDIHYDVTQLPPGVFENKLGLVFYNTDTAQWQQAAVLHRDPAAHTLLVRLDHFTEFALTGSSPVSVYLPTVMKYH